MTSIENMEEVKICVYVCSLPLTYTTLPYLGTKTTLMTTRERKAEQLAQLNEQVAILHNNLSKFDGLIKDTSVQFNTIQKLGVMHGSLFMASHTVFGDSYNDKGEKQ